MIEILDISGVGGGSGEVYAVLNNEGPRKDFPELRILSVAGTPRIICTSGRESLTNLMLALQRALEVNA